MDTLTTSPIAEPAIRCDLGDPATAPVDDPTTVPQALNHLRTAARYACGATARNGHYPPELPVAVLADTTAALYEMARMTANYVGDYWSEAGTRVNRAGDLLAEARGLLDAARHQTVLIPAADDGDGDTLATATATA